MSRIFSRRGFIFTVDALFSMVLLATVAYAFMVFTMQPEYASKTTQMQSLARDYAKLSAMGRISADAFKAETGLDAGDALTMPHQREKMQVARATYVYYPSDCGGTDCGYKCSLSHAQAEICLSNQAITGATSNKTVWVFT